MPPVLRAIEDETLLLRYEAVGCSVDANIEKWFDRLVFFSSLQIPFHTQAFPVDCPYDESDFKKKGKKRENIEKK